MKRRPSSALGLFTSLFCVVLNASLLPSAKAEIVVNSADDENDTPAGAAISLREAVRDAASGETITFAPALDGQVLVLKSVVTVSGKSISVDASALPAGAVLQTISSSSQHFDVTAGAALSLTNLTVQGRRPLVSGGGISNAGTLTLTNCTLRDNQAPSGTAGGSGTDGHPPIQSPVDSVNAGNGGFGGPGAFGGALRNSGTVTATRTAFVNNAAGDGGPGGFGGSGYYGLGGSSSPGGGRGGYAGFGGGGGAIYSSGPLILTDCVFSGNQAGNGGAGGMGGYYQGFQASPGGGGRGGDGGAVVQSGPLTISGTTFTANRAGGGGYGSSGGFIRENETEGSGGALYHASGTAVITNSTFSGNSMSSLGPSSFHGTGAAIRAAGGTLEMIHCTVSGNSAPNNGPGGGIHVTAGSPVFRNCLVAGNTSASGESNIHSTSGTPVFTPPSIFTDSPAVDPKLGPLAVFSGVPAPVRPLLAGSPALDAGAVLAVPPATDQRGLPRAAGVPDLGAVEMQPAEPASLKPQSIDFSQLSDRVYSGSNFTVSLTASASSGLPVTLTVLSGPATLTNNTLTVTGRGSIAVRAVQNGDAVYASAPPVTRTLTATRQLQSIFFNPEGSYANFFSDPVFVALPVNAGSGLPVTWSVVSGNGSFTGNVLSAVGSGVQSTVRIRGTQPGNDTFEPVTAEWNINLNPVFLTLAPVVNVVMNEGAPSQAYQFTATLPFARAVPTAVFNPASFPRVGFTPGDAVIPAGTTSRVITIEPVDDLIYYAGDVYLTSPWTAGVTLFTVPLYDNDGPNSRIGAASIPVFVRGFKTRFDFSSLGPNQNYPGQPFDGRVIEFSATAGGSPATVTPAASAPAPAGSGTSAHAELRFTQAGPHVLTVSSLLADGVTRQTGTFNVTVLPENGDSDGDGVPDAVEMVLGTSIAPAPATPQPLVSERAGSALFAVLAQRPLNLNGRTAIVQVSNDLTTWSTAPAAQTTTTPNADGQTERVSVAMNAASAPAWRFARLRVSEAP